MIEVLAVMEVQGGSMTAREFYDTVVKMRKAQRDYFRTRSQRSLNESKQFEKLVDAEIKRVEQIQQQQADNQQQKLLRVTSTLAQPTSPFPIAR